MGTEMVLQPADGGCVEVIGGLVEQQQFGRRGQHAGQGQPGLLPAGQGAECAVPGEVAEPEAVQRGVGPGIRLVAAAFLVRRQQVAVGREPRVGGFLAGHRLLRLADPALQVAEPGEGGVDGVLDRAAGVECECLGEVAAAAREADGDVAPSGTSVPAISRSRVDFPEPFSPMTPAFSPGRTVRDT